jgi:hypothetical protein
VSPEADRPRPWFSAPRRHRSSRCELAGEIEPIWRRNVSRRTRRWRPPSPSRAIGVPAALARGWGNRPIGALGVARDDLGRGRLPHKSLGRAGTGGHHLTNCAGLHGKPPPAQAHRAQMTRVPTSPGGAGHRTDSCRAARLRATFLMAGEEGHRRSAERKRSVGAAV